MLQCFLSSSSAVWCFLGSWINPFYQSPAKQKNGNFSNVNMAHKLVILLIYRYKCSENFSFFKIFFLLIYLKIKKKCREAAKNGGGNFCGFAAGKKKNLKRFTHWGRRKAARKSPKRKKSKKTISFFSLLCSLAYGGRFFCPPSAGGFPPLFPASREGFFYLVIFQLIRSCSCYGNWIDTYVTRFVFLNGCFV